MLILLAFAAGLVLGYLSHRWQVRPKPVTFGEPFVVQVDGQTVYAGDDLHVAKELRQTALDRGQDAFLVAWGKDRG
jgi:hypothetical protein